MTTILIKYGDCTATSLLNIVDVVESYLTNDYTVTYEYVPFSLGSSSEHPKMRDFL